MPVILLKRDGLHDIDVVRRDWSSSRLNRESDDSAEAAISRRQDDGGDGFDDGSGSSDGGFNGNGNGDGHHHHHHNPDNTYNTGEATSSADGGTSQSAEPTSPVSGASPTSQSSNSQSSAIGQDGSSSTDPTSSASGGASSSTSVSDPSITSFPSSTESSTTTGIPSSASESATPQNAAAIGPNKGAIAGGVVGGMFGLAVIVIACFLLYKTRRRKHMAPSSEFMAVTGNPASFSRLGTRADDPSEMPPPFTQGNFNTPAYEKNAMGESHLPL